jgi:hypothetical protein
MSGDILKPRETIRSKTSKVKAGVPAGLKARGKVFHQRTSTV